MSPERLDKIIASAGQYSRREAARLCASGGVTVNGAAVKDPSVKTDPETAIITINGSVFTYKKHVYIMLNKPAGVISASDGKGERTVVDLVPPEMKRRGLFPAGRLDKDTVGLVLITDDGDFAHYILSPRHHIEKVYVFKSCRPIPQPGMEAIRNGIAGFRPAKISETAPCEYKITLTEGRYHEIKLMVHAAGSEVVYLKRIQMGKLRLDESLGEGECREVKREDII